MGSITTNPARQRRHKPQTFGTSDLVKGQEMMTASLYDHYPALSPVMMDGISTPLIGLRTGLTPNKAVGHRLPTESTVLLILVREVLIPHVCDIGLDSRSHHIVEIHVAAQESGIEFVG